jgi:acid phosphatase
LVVIEENHSFTQMRAEMPFLAQLSDTYGYATHWTALRHPSEPNYLAIAGGSTFGVSDDAPPQAHEEQVGRADSVFGLALDAGRTAATYAQSMPGNCHASDYPPDAPKYAVRHNPWVYFPTERADCRRHDQPLRAFASDAKQNVLPDVGFLIPDLDHDAHDGTLSAADTWLHSTLEPALQSKDFTSGRLVIVVTADEDDKSSDNTVLTSVLTPALSHKVTDAPLTHYSLTRYLCQVLGVPLLGHAATAPDLSAAFGL